MSATAVLGKPGFSARIVNTGASDEARHLENLLKDALNHYSQVAPRNLALEELARIYSQCRQEGWDGYSAQPVSAGAYHAAVRFLLAIPTAFPMPDVVPEPDGDISLEWECGRWNALSMSIGDQGRISYAALLGRNRRKKGSEVFDDVIPPEILSILWQVTHH